MNNQIKPLFQLGKTLPYVRQSHCNRRFLFGFFLIPKKMSPSVLNCAHPSVNKVGHIGTLRVFMCVRQHVTDDFPESLQKVSTES